MDLSSYSSKRVLVTGGAGAIGSTLVHRLIDLGAEVTVLDNLTAGHEWALPQNIYFIQGDITNPETLDAAFANHPQIVTHLAARYGNLQSIETPETDLFVNGLGAMRVLEWAERTEGVERVLLASSGCSIYGSTAQQPLREDHPPSLHYSSPYQAHKLLLELYGNYFHLRGLATVRLRFFSSYGPRETPGRLRGVVPAFFWYAMRKEPLPITGDGSETRSFTYVEDLASGILAAGVAEGIEGEAINLAGGEPRSIAELAELVNMYTGNPAGVTLKPRRPWDHILTQKVSIAKAQKLLGYAPTTTLEQGIERTYAWFKANWSKIEQEARW